ncbi:MAG: hypothetical protein MUP82_05665, partial [Candidatus Marinimicrobia bacterium]|nr:hypothetical protein [Candidatus Neomarinimicrobiota bacterium]
FKVKAGMVRASFGIYSTKENVTALVSALKDIVAKRDEYTKLYALDGTGIYRHKTFKPNEADLFNVELFIDEYLQKL